MPFLTRKSTISTTMWVKRAVTGDPGATPTGAAPAGVTQRDVSIQTGSGRYASRWVDSGGPVPTGPYGGLKATTNAASSNAVVGTVALRPTGG